MRSRCCRSEAATVQVDSTAAQARTLRTCLAFGLERTGLAGRAVAEFLGPEYDRMQ